jgi:hypothetical protein
MLNYLSILLSVHVCVFFFWSQMNTHRCFNDGFPFSHAPTLLPTKYDQIKKTFVYDNIVFCSPSCVKGWLFRDVHTNSERIQLFSLYCEKVLGLSCLKVDICPDHRFIQEYMVEPEGGITIETFRAVNPTHLLVTGTHTINPTIDKRDSLHLIPKEDEEGLMNVPHFIL